MMTAPTTIPTSKAFTGYVYDALFFDLFMDIGKEVMDAAAIKLGVFTTKMNKQIDKFFTERKRACKQRYQPNTAPR
jgi:hypothetical protein